MGNAPHFSDPFKEQTMLFLVRMDVNIPRDLPEAQANEIKAREKAYSQDLQRDGRWKSIWRVVGEYANYSIFDVSSNDELQQLLQGLQDKQQQPNATALDWVLGEYSDAAAGSHSLLTVDDEGGTVYRHRWVHRCRCSGGLGWWSCR